MFVGSICAVAIGVTMPAFAYIWGGMTDSFNDIDVIVEEAKQRMLIFIYIGIGALFAGWLMILTWTVVGERQGMACKKAYLKALLRQ